MDHQGFSAKFPGLVRSVHAILPDMRRIPAFILVALALARFSSQAVAHPIPDVPVHAFFEENRACRIQVEVDPRCFEADPNTAPSLLHGQLRKELSEEQRAGLKAKAKEFLRHTVELFFEPQGRILPEFEFEFTGQEGAPLKNADEVVVLTGSWSTTVPDGMKGYRIRALDGGKLCVLFLNNLRGKAVERVAVLFPGETSYLLDPAGPAPVTSAAAFLESPDAAAPSSSPVQIAVVLGAVAVAASGLWWMAQRAGWL